MKKAAPEKTFIPAPIEDESCSCNQCPYMKLNTIEKIYLCMKNKYPEIKIDEELRLKALKPIERMLEMS
jgi:quinolinate synthase